MQCVAKKIFYKNRCLQSMQSPLYRMETRRPENAKHRTSWGKTSVLLPRKYGTFMQRSPMFSIAETVAIGLYPKVFCLLVAGSENVCGLLSGRDDGVGWCKRKYNKNQIFCNLILLNKSLVLYLQWNIWLFNFKIDCLWVTFSVLEILMLTTWWCLSWTILSVANSSRRSWISNVPAYSLNSGTVPFASSSCSSSPITASWFPGSSSFGRREEAPKLEECDDDEGGKEWRRQGRETIEGGMGGREDGRKN